MLLERSHGYHDGTTIGIEIESKMVGELKWNDSPTDLENQQPDLDIIKNGKHTHEQTRYAQTLKQAPYTHSDDRWIGSTGGMMITRKTESLGEKTA